MCDGLQSHEFNGGACFKSTDGEMFFGGINGFNSFFPEDISDNTYIPPIVITSITTYSNNVKSEKRIWGVNELNLSYNESFIYIEFAALNYNNSEKNQYAYMIEGVNEDWIHLGNRHNITITNLSPGNYVFKVKGSNNDGIWNEEGISIKINVQPPFWQTWWFKTFIVILVLGLAFLWYRTRIKYLSLKYEAEAAMNSFFEKNKISNREQEIIRLIIKGKSNKDIEEELYISHHTVKNHIYNIYQKLGINSSRQLINLISNSTRSKSKTKQ